MKNDDEVIGSEKELHTPTDAELKEEKELDQEEVKQEEAASEEKVDDLTKAKMEAAEMKDKYLRLYSEFENFRRRSAKERLELIQTSTADLVKELLEVLDDFERAKKSNKELNDEASNSVKEGFDLVQNKFEKILKNQGLKKMEAKGSDFDADLHEAIAKIPAPDKKQKGKVVDVVEEGYMLNDKIIRFAKVVIGE